jgi:hypothetical protein
MDIDSEMNEVSGKEFKRMIIRMVSKIKEDMNEYLN